MIPIIKSVKSKCCNADVTRVNLTFYCLKCRKHCEIIDKEKPCQK
jgi:hypothetical protein